MSYVCFFLQNLGLNPLRAHQCSDDVPLFWWAKLQSQLLCADSEESWVHFSVQHACCKFRVWTYILTQFVLNVCSDVYVYWWVWISGKNLGGGWWSPGRPVCRNCDDEHVPRSLRHLRLQICFCNHFFWSAGLNDGIQLHKVFFSSLASFCCLTPSCCFPGFSLCCSWEVAAVPLRTGSCCQNVGFLWTVFQHPLSTAQTRWG